MTTLSPVFQAHGPEPAHEAERWEYLVAPLQEVKGLKKADEPWAPDQLNELGRQGWELAGVGDDAGHTLFFKRPARQPPA